MAKVEVHSFSKYNIKIDQNLTRRYKLTAAEIKRRQAEIIPNTAELVDEADLDAEGRYFAKGE